MQPSGSSTPETVSETVYPGNGREARHNSVEFGLIRAQGRSLTPVTGVRIPLGTPNDSTRLHESEPLT